MASDTPSLANALSRSVLNTLVPGLVAIAPWFLLLLQHTSATLGLKEYPTVANAFLFGAVAIAGSLCNSFGTAIEANIFDVAQREKYAVEDDWFDYLAFNEQEPVGFRYLGRLYTTLSFELAMVMAAPSFALGGAFLLYLRFPFIGVPAGILIGTVATIVVISVFYTQARLSHQALCETRHQLMGRLRRSKSRNEDSVHQ